MFQIQGLDDAAQQTGAGKDLQLRIEVGGIVHRAIDVGGGFAGVHRIVFQIDLYARRSLVYVGLARYIDTRQHSDYGCHSDHHPEPLPDRAPVIEQVDFTFRALRSVAVTGRSIRTLLWPVKLARINFALHHFCCFAHYDAF